MHFGICAIPLDGNQTASCIEVNAVVIDSKMRIVSTIGMVNHMLHSTCCIHPAKEVLSVIITRIKCIPEFLVRCMHIDDPIAFEGIAWRLVKPRNFSEGFQVAAISGYAVDMPASRTPGAENKLFAIRTPRGMRFCKIIGGQSLRRTVGILHHIQPVEDSKCQFAPIWRRNGIPDLSGQCSSSIFYGVFEKDFRSQLQLAIHFVGNFRIASVADVYFIDFAPKRSEEVFAVWRKSHGRQYP